MVRYSVWFLNDVCVIFQHPYLVYFVLCTVPIGHSRQSLPADTWTWWLLCLFSVTTSLVFWSLVFDDTRCSVSLPESQMANISLSSYCPLMHDLVKTLRLVCLYGTTFCLDVGLVTCSCTAMVLQYSFLTVTLLVFSSLLISSHLLAKFKTSFDFAQVVCVSLPTSISHFWWCAFCYSTLVLIRTFVVKYLRILFVSKTDCRAAWFVYIYFAQRSC